MTPSRRKQPVSPRRTLLLALTLALAVTPVRLVPADSSPYPLRAVPADAEAECSEGPTGIWGDPDMPESPTPTDPGRTSRRRASYSDVRGPGNPPPQFSLLSYLARWPLLLPR